MRRKNLILALILAEAAVLAFLAFRILSFQPEEIQLGFRNWTGRNARWDDGWGWSAEEETETEGLITSGELELPDGTYALSLEYEADSMQNIVLQDHRVPVSQNEKSCRIRFEVTDGQKLTVRADYSGKGSFSVTNMTAYSTSALLCRQLVWALIFMALLDSFCFVWAAGKDPFGLLAVLGIGLLCSLPVLIRGVNGADIYFHLMRMESLADGLERGIFPLRLSEICLNGWGYPASVYYGDLLLYAGALLRLLGFSVTAAYKGFIVFANLLGAACAFCAFLYVFKEKKTAALTALVWCTCNYHLSALYVRATAGEFTAMIFFPLIAAAFWDLSRRELPDRVRAVTDVFLFSFGFAGVAVSHILSTELAVFASVIAALFMLPGLLRPRRLLILLGGAAGSLLLSLFFTVPFLDSCLHDQVGILYYTPSLQDKGITLIEMFSFFCPIFGFENGFPVQRTFSVNPGIVPAAALFAAAWALLSRKGTRRCAALTLLSLVFLWVSSVLFPWKSLSGTPLSFLTSVQFPWRWITVATLLLTLLAGLLLEEFRSSVRSAGVLVLLGCLISVSFFFTEYSGNSNVIEPYDRAEAVLRANIGAGEYLRYDPETRETADYEAALGRKAEVTGENLDWLECVSRDGNTFVLDVMAQMEQEGTVDVPVFHYYGMTARDTAGNLLPVSDGENFCVRVTVPAGFDGKLTVRFEEPLLWRAASVISLISLLGGLAAYLIFLRKHRGDREIPGGAAQAS